QRKLADWVVESKSLESCITAARVAAAQKSTTGEWLASAGANGPAAAALVWSRRDEVRRALELEVYAADKHAQADALADLAAFLSQPVGRVAFAAMASRAPQTDGILADALVAYSERTFAPVGALLLKA